MNRVAFFDESSDNENVFTVAGLVSTVEMCDVELRPAWGRLLDRVGSAYFRMSEFENGRGAFSGLTKDVRAVVAADVAMLVRRSVLNGVAVSVPIAEWNERKERMRAVRWTTPYVLCGHVCALVAAGERRNVDLCFEAGGPGWGQLQSLLDERPASPGGYTGRVTCVSKECEAGLQAADVYAYEAMKDAQVRLGKSRRGMRRSLMAMEGHRVPLGLQDLRFQRAVAGVARSFERKFENILLDGNDLDGLLAARGDSEASRRSQSCGAGWPGSHRRMAHRREGGPGGER